MAESADASAGARVALERIRALVAEQGQDLLGDVEVLEAAIGQRDALKRAGDAMVYEFSHPKPRGSKAIEAVVEYRRVSEQMNR